MNNSVAREKAVFCEAVEITDLEQRRHFLDQACGADKVLRAQVEGLLALSQGSGDFFKECAPALEAQPSDADQVLSAGEAGLGAEAPETKAIGHYKLLQRLGEGGCGVVYMAEQEQPIRRRVALKIIKLGMDTRNVIARFEAERQALALMDHANIARVLDAGATETGRPYFVMELVYGVKITEYCDQNRVSMRERLELFIEVCNAVQHAHQKGIIHRDLKPSNIMVTMHDGVPVPKVIDFGIAKATEQRLTDKTLFTSYAQLMGTPAYMSPEQMELSGLNLDTRSDIYSLGVLLYELLTGRTPFDTTDLLKLGVEELRRTICEREPLSPSAKLQTLNDEELTKTARRRHMEPPRLLSQLRGDLDWIVLKCLEKDRTRRYATANGLAMDIGRYLHEETVLARPPSQLYRLQKLVRRNRMVFLSGTTAALALLFGIVFALRDAALTRRAEQEQRTLRERAELAKAEADASNQRLTRSLFIREWQDAEHLLEQGKVGTPLAWFARVVRTHPDDVIARTRLLSILTERSFALPSGAPFAHEASVYSALLTSDGSHLVTACGDHRVRIWALDSDRALRILPEHFSDPAVTFVFPGNRVLVEDSESVSLWDLSGTRLKGITIPAHSHARGLVSTTPDGRFVMLNGKDSWQMWDATELQPIGLPLLNRQPATGNGRYLFGYEGQVAAWEASTGKRVWDGTVSDAAGVWELMGAALDQQNQRLVFNRWTGSGGASELSIWNLGPEGLPRTSVPSQVVSARTRISAQTFSPSGDQLFVGDLEGSVGLVDLAAPERSVQVLNCEHEGRINSTSCGRNGHLLATGSADGTAKLWDVRMGSPEPRIFTNAVTCWDAKFSPDSKWFVMAGVGAVEIRETATGSLRHRLRFDGLVTHLDVSRDGRRLVACGESGDVCVWDTESGDPIIQPLHALPGDYSAFSQDGRWFCLLSSDSTTRVFETETGRQVAPAMINNAQGIRAVFTRDARRLIVATVSGRLEFWSLPDGVRTDPAFRHKDVIWTTVLSPDERFLLTASRDRTAALWDAETGRFIREFRHDQQVLTVAFSPDARTILTGDGSRRARIWDTATGKPLRELMPHPGSVWYGEFSRDGTMILTGDDAGNARLWDRMTGLPLTGWVKNGVSLKRTRLSPDGRWALSAAEDGRVRVWPVLRAQLPAPAWLTELAEALAGRRLKDDGALEQVAPEHWFALNKWLGASTADDLYARWAKWFLVERMKDKPLLFVP